MGVQGPERSGSFHHRALDDDPAGRVLPEGDEELARQGDDRGLRRARPYA